MKLKEIILLLESVCPRQFSVSNDNCGLQTGSLDKKINKILLVLEITAEVLEYAVENSIDLLITHHPLLFKKISSITSETSLGNKLLTAIKNNIATYSMHTNADAIQNGLNDYLAKLLDLTPQKPFEILESSSLAKLVFFTPLDAAEKVRLTLLDSGIGTIGKYSHCSFNVEGMGTFFPHEGSTPHLGEVGKLEKTKEVRLETILYKKDIPRTISLLKSIHPYEEVAYDIYPLLNEDGKTGIGRFCTVKEPKMLSDFLSFLPTKLDVDFVRYNGYLNKPIKHVGICTGSGGSYVSKLNNVDLLITGDINYHQAMEAIENDISFIDIGHEQEKIFIPFVNDILAQAKISPEIVQYKNTINPFICKSYKEK